MGRCDVCGGGTQRLKGRFGRGETESGVKDR